MTILEQLEEAAAASSQALSSEVAKIVNGNVVTNSVDVILTEILAEMQVTNYSEYPRFERVLKEILDLYPEGLECLNHFFCWANENDIRLVACVAKVLLSRDKVVMSDRTIEQMLSLLKIAKYEEQRETLVKLLEKGFALEGEGDELFAELLKSFAKLTHDEFVALAYALRKRPLSVGCLIWYLPAMIKIYFSIGDNDGMTGKYVHMRYQK